ncbi:neurogenic locus protein delta [Coccinella septempunctata]|uniref:neurogenic locus protein delta n=1 Tax=Coccinella septempunctata TaxID=41139 RepID=UPI001D07835C|nr:neurogenic locus protein delta [Coccinella septempunctata]
MKIVLMLKYLLLITFLTHCKVSGSRYVPKWKKQACEIPASQNEHSHYICTDDGEVKCLPGWTGDLCDVPICKSGCDPIQGYCNRPGECVCKLGYYGDKCNKCIPLPGCQHGFCRESFECKCREGWKGVFCSEPVCGKDCHPARGYCDAPGECKCRLGWAGKSCQQCQVLPGCQHGYCEKPLECRCYPGYTGLLCQIPICSKTCHRERGYCRKPGECRCKVGWWGKNCDVCYPYPGCVNGDCRRPWECNCKEGWGGMLCDEELTYCRDNPNTCQNGAKCIPLTKEDGNYRCYCREGSYGRNCEYTDVYFTTTSRPPMTSTTRKTTYITSNLTLSHVDPNPIVVINEQVSSESDNITTNVPTLASSTATTSTSTTISTITTDKNINLNDTNFSSNSLSENETF